MSNQSDQKGGQGWVGKKAASVGQIGIEQKQLKTLPQRPLKWPKELMVNDSQLIKDIQVRHCNVTSLPFFS